MLITIQMTVMMMMMNTHHSSEIFPVNFHFEFHSMDEADWYLITNFLSAFFIMIITLHAAQLTSWFQQFTAPEKICIFMT